MGKPNNIVHNFGTMDDYYTNLTYDNTHVNVMQARKELSALSRNVKIEHVNDIPTRFFIAVTTIQDNLSLFKRICKGVDLVATITEYLINYGIQIKYEQDESAKINLIVSTMLTLFDVSNIAEMNSFLETVILIDSNLGHVCEPNVSIKFSNFMNLPHLYQSHHVILLEDSDLYAVINFLQRSNYTSYLKAIWVQEIIRFKFMWLLKRYNISILLEPDVDMHVFRCEQEFITHICNENVIGVTSHKMNIISIWSENIIAAKNLARFLNVNVVFINTHMNFCGGIILLPYLKLSVKVSNCHVSAIFNSLNDTDIISYNETRSRQQRVYNLYYNGIWQRPVNGTYWVHQEAIFANGTKDDYNRCYHSALKGFEIWNTISANDKIDIICAFIIALKHNGEIELANLISKWIQFRYIMYEHSSSCFQNKEVIRICKARGIMLLNEEQKDVLFHRLILTLITGNAAIVLCTRNSYNVAPFCEIFSRCKIPPGVINFLSSNDNSLQNVETNFCLRSCLIRKENIFMEDQLKTYHNLTVIKQIILPTM